MPDIKAYLKVFVDSNETLIANGFAPLIQNGILAADKDAGNIKFVSGVGKLATHSIQRLVRFKAFTTASLNSTKIGDRIVESRNRAQKPEYVEVTAKLGTEYELVKYEEPFEKNSFLLNQTGMQRWTAYEAKHRMVMAEIECLTEVWNATTAVDLDTTDMKVALQTILTAHLELSYKADKFKYGSDGIYAIVTPEFAQKVAMEKLTNITWTNNADANGLKEAGLWEEGIGQVFKFGGITFYVDKSLNFIETPAGTDPQTEPAKRAQVILLDREAFAHAGLDYYLNVYTDNAQGRQFYGIEWLNLFAVVDPSRIKAFHGTSTITKSKDINDLT